MDTLSLRRIILLFFCMALPVARALAADASVAVPPGPITLEGAESYVYRELSPEALRLHVFKPKDWKAEDRRPAFVWFFGGGWTTGTAANSVWMAKWAAELGFVAIAPDYRVKNRFGTSPLASVADARAVLRWVQTHASEIGIDPQRVVVGGNSAGGHIALWTAIGHTPPGSSPEEAPLFKPAAVLLTSAVSDTSRETGYTPARFGENARELSPVHQLDVKMPPMIVFHGTADALVPHAQALALHDRLVATGNEIELVSVEGGSHNYAGDLPGWADKTQAMTEAFLRRHGLVPGVK